MSNSLRNRVAGLVAVICFSAVLSQPAAVLSQPGAEWRQVGTGDFNGDGKADILWRDASGNVAVSLMDGLQVVQSRVVGNRPNNWTIVGTADFNGDGKSDILWRDTNGDVAIWLMNGARITQSRAVGNEPTAWTIVGTGDFNGDGKADILWRDPSGNLTEWFMNGTHIAQSVAVNNLPTNWTPVVDINDAGSVGIVWTGFNIGGSLGSLNASNSFTNFQQFTLCPPFCTPDLTPNPAASATSSGFYGNVFLGYNQRLPGTPLVIGAEAFYGGGGSEIKFTGIPGTFGPGGIASAAGAAGDSVTVTPTWNAGVLGKIGTTLQIGGAPVFVAFNGGVGFQHFNVAINCTGSAGACGGNGIPLQSLTTSSTVGGALFGGELDIKVASIFPQAASSPFWNSALIGFRYLHVDNESLTTTVGNRTQIQLTTNQKLTTDSAVATFTYQFNQTGFWASGVDIGTKFRY
jgi:hypothetical protein